MKKNRMMRLASSLLVLTLLTTCVISGTFAKYTTQAGGSDTARVAKWGVEVSSTGMLFAEEYDEKSADNSAHTEKNTITVQSINATTGKDSVVAPGTQNTTGLTFSITGKPEVAVKLAVVVTDSDTDSAKDIFLAQGTYADLTTGTSRKVQGAEVTEDGGEDTVTVGNGGYHPIKYTLTQTKGQTSNILVNGGTLAEVENALEQLSKESIAPNTDLSEQFGSFTLTWAWNFPEKENADTDKMDTLLGKLATDSSIKAKKDNSTGNFTALADTDFSTTTDIKIEISVTQID